MIDPTQIESMLETFADRIADKVAAKLAARAEGNSALSRLLDQYGPVMTREQVSKTLQVSKRHLQNMEKAGRIVQLPRAGKEATYETEAVYRLMKHKTKIKVYAK